MEIDYQSRMAALLEKSDADVIAIVPGANMVYFTGLEFHLSERPTIALIDKEGLSFILPELEIPKLRERPDLEARIFQWSDSDQYRGAFMQAARDLHLVNRVLGVDGLTMRVFEWLAFKKVGISSETALDVRRLLLDVRSRKEPAEVDAMRRAIAISETALERTIAWVQPGMTERQIAEKLNKELQEAGSQGNAFEPLVLVGERSALPHGFPGDRQLGADEYLLIDYGGMFDGYPADITRTFCLGTPTKEMQRIYDTVLQANLAAQAAAAPGVPAELVDKAARDVIEAAGYGPYFIHRTGHGLGLQGHEEPNIVAGNGKALQPGNVFTIEPGIYIPELGGVRIEDNILVTEDGIEVLTSFPRSLT